MKRLSGLVLVMTAAAFIVIGCSNVNDPALDDNSEYSAMPALANGDGIPANHRDKILQPFFTTKTEGRHSGLGLNIAAGIVERHGGVLELRPGQSQGTIVVVTLPAAG